MNGRRPFQPRHEVRLGSRELAIAGCAFLLVWVLTFIFGVLVGREFAGPAGPAPKAAASAGAGGLAERGESPGKAERLRAEERLTFYETLTAPTPTLPAVGPPTVEERIVPREPQTRPAVPRPERRGGAGGSGGAAKARVAAATPAAAGPAEPLWTVQVSSFRSRALAEDLRKRLAARGYDAYLLAVATEEGRVRHRVRVGGFPTRTEAERVAAELRADRHPSVFVTTRSR